MASTLVKAAIGLAGATTVGGGATFVYLNSGNNKSTEQKENKPNTGVQNEDDSPKEVKKAEPQANTVIDTLFEVAKITLLTDAPEDAEKWDQKWTDFKGEYNTLKEHKSWKFESWNGEGPDQGVGIKLLREKCTANSKEKVVNEQSQLFLEVKKFCTKPKTEQPENK